MEQHVHHTEAVRQVADVSSSDGLIAQVLALGRVQDWIVVQDVLVGQEKEASRAASWITDGVDGLRVHDFDDRFDERPRGEVLASLGTPVGDAFGQQALIGITLDVGIQGAPVLVADEVDNESAKNCWLLDLVRGLLKDGTQGPGFLGQLLEHLAVVGLELVSVECHQ